MPVKKGEGSIDVEKIMKEIRRKVEKRRSVTYTDEELFELLNVDPGEPLDKRSVRDDFLQALHKAKTESGFRQFEMSFDSYLGLGGGFRGWIIRKTRRLFWPIARLFWNQGYMIDFINQSNRYRLLIEHNLILELTRLRIDNDRLRDGYQVLLHKIEQLEARERELEKLLMGKNSRKAKAGK